MMMRRRSTPGPRRSFRSTATRCCFGGRRPGSARAALDPMVTDTSLRLFSLPDGAQPRLALARGGDSIFSMSFDGSTVGRTCRVDSHRTERVVSDWASARRSSRTPAPAGAARLPRRSPRRRHGLRPLRRLWVHAALRGRRARQRGARLRDRLASTTPTFSSSRAPLPPAAPGRTRPPRSTTSCPANRSTRRRCRGSLSAPTPRIARDNYGIQPVSATVLYFAPRRRPLRHRDEAALATFPGWANAVAGAFIVHPCGYGVCAETY